MLWAHVFVDRAGDSICNIVQINSNVNQKEAPVGWNIVYGTYDT